jgi:hypothetical protein
MNVLPARFLPVAANHYFLSFVGFLWLNRKVVGLITKRNINFVA